MGRNSWYVEIVECRQEIRGGVFAYCKVGSERQRLIRHGFLVNCGYSPSIQYPVSRWQYDVRNVELKDGMVLVPNSL
jgi:hypothetical protein